jgi:hypothetical protein
MLMESLAEHDSVEDAAEWAAGNYREWSCFMWLGESNMPHPEHICLGYLVNNVESTVDQLTNSEVVTEALAEWFGEDCSEALVGPFSSSVSGDRNVLGGIQIRVYEADGETITPAFHRLYELAEGYGDVRCLDEERREVVNRREYLRWLGGELPSMCKEHGLEYDDSLIVTVFEILDERGYADFDDGFCWDHTEDVVKELAVDGTS